MKDKFEIFQEIIMKEVQYNHYRIYITIGQLGEIMRRVNEIAEKGEEKPFIRSISPMGDAGKNKI